MIGFIERKSITTLRLAEGIKEYHYKYCKFMQHQAKKLLILFSKFDKKASEQPKTFHNDLLSTKEKRPHLTHFIPLVSFYIP